jgi:hypothetical protein
VTVLLLHAFPFDERMWESQLAALSEYEVIAPRLYGRGQTMDAWADSIAGEIEGSHSRDASLNASAACCSRVPGRTRIRRRGARAAPTRSP